MHLATGETTRILCKRLFKDFNSKWEAIQDTYSQSESENPSIHHKWCQYYFLPMQKCFFSNTSKCPDSFEVGVNHVLVTVCYNQCPPRL